jgi:hypothetical protein
MLGYLEMAVDECIQKYNEVMGKVFAQGFFGKKGRFAMEGEFYDATVLETVIKDLIRERIGRDDVALLDENRRCKM